jgi:rod shape-determining protein MreC
MLKFFLRNRSKLFLAALLLFCVWLVAHHRDGRTPRANTLKGFSLSVWLPIQKTISSVLAFPENTLNAIRELRNLRQEVNRLQLENQSLHLELSNHKSLESEVTRLERILQIKSKFPHKAKIARIIAHDPSTWNRSFVIDIGSDDGVLMDSPVVSEQGIVGRVLDTTPKNSRVLLMTDADSSVAGIDERSRVTGIVLGTGRNQFKYGYVSASEDIQKDDVIVSSGLGGVFPKGYAIGTVQKKSLSENGLNSEVDIAPAVDFAALDYVFVLPPIDIY